VNRMYLARGPSKSAKRLIHRLVGEQLTGTIDYFRFPGRRPGWGGPFNGQPLRCELFAALTAHVRPYAIVETGTYLGTTTEFLAETGLPVYTVEAHPRNYGFARARLWRRRNVTLFHGDSRAVLQRLLADRRLNLPPRTLFYYLDAHWNDDLPLGEEINIIFNSSSSGVVMVDDFQVPFDAGYGYDDYGPNKALSIAYIAQAIAVHQLQVFYPASPSHCEGGLRRGCVVLAKRDVHGRTLSAISLLRPAQTPEHITNIL
jgi:hypothetical protein